MTRYIYIYIYHSIVTYLSYEYLIKPEKRSKNVKKIVNPQK